MPFFRFFKFEFRKVLGTNVKKIKKIPKLKIFTRNFKVRFKNSSSGFTLQTKSKPNDSTDSTVWAEHLPKFYELYKLKKAAKHLRPQLEQLVFMILF